MQIEPGKTHRYRTDGGIDITRASMAADYHQARLELITALDTSPGVLLSSAVEVPGRYARWDLGFVQPPLRLVAQGLACELQALNARGEVLLPLITAGFHTSEDLHGFEADTQRCRFQVKPPEAVVFEELRSRQRSVFSVLRGIVAQFASTQDQYLGLYGAFGYELAFQFEAVAQRQVRADDQRDLVLYLPDTILVVDHKRELAQRHYYEFEAVVDKVVVSTRHLPRRIQDDVFVPATGATAEVHSDHPAGAYAATVTKALEYFRRGDLFEAVPGQTFVTACPQQPSQLFRRLQASNPAPYGALLNLGGGEFLVAASPEMYVRVEGRRVETCPISGTIRRGATALEDAEQIRSLLNSAKDEAELAMCTDVDRNDKARICEPGSIRIIGRRQVELYSRLIHTVDHVEGQLRPEFDALDAFLSHAWAVTVTGAPKAAAMQFIEDHERSPRRWYGGAMGCLLFNGDLNTGLTIRTIRLHKGVAEVRAGATLLADSEPQAEEAETRLKAEALLAVLQPQADAAPPAVSPLAGLGVGLDILVVDHQDSFVHTLAGYLRESGAIVRTVRRSGVAAQLALCRPALVVLSPGPGRPHEQGLHQTLALCEQLGVPVFGVCLGLQGMVEYFGGSLRTLAQPMHGKASLLVQCVGPLFAGCGPQLRVGRYHSLVAERLPDCLQVLARSADGEIMALQHRELPLLALQFHPESLLSLHADGGRQILANALHLLTGTAVHSTGEGLRQASST